MESEIRQSTPERLVYWYLRLNGFLTIENFLIHPEWGPKIRTDADILAVRFSQRSERLQMPMVDDPTVTNCSTLCNIIIGEVKTGYCALNGPWTKPEKMNMHRVLKAIGCFSEDDIDDAAVSLYSTAQFSKGSVTCRLFAFGDRVGLINISGVQQVLFNNMIRFVYLRLKKYANQKSEVKNWAYDGRELKRLSKSCRTLENFSKEVRSMYNLRELECHHGE